MTARLIAMHQRHVWAILLSFSLCQTLGHGKALLVHLKATLSLLIIIIFKRNVSENRKIKYYFEMYCSYYEIMFETFCSKYRHEVSWLQVFKYYNGYY